MPYLVIEALAAQRPVVASRVGGIPEILGTDSEALTRPGDAQDLSRVMVRASVDPDWQARVMPKPEEIRSRFSSVTMAENMLALYRTLLEERS